MWTAGPKQSVAAVLLQHFLPVLLFHHFDRASSSRRHTLMAWLLRWMRRCRRRAWWQVCVRLCWKAARLG